MMEIKIANELKYSMFIWTLYCSSDDRIKGSNELWSSHERIY